MLRKLLFITLLVPILGTAQKFTDSQIKEMIETYKGLDRGPYKSINWFCEDGTIRDSKDPCPGDLEGIQHASYKPQVIELAQRNHIYFGEILASNEIWKFWDGNNNHSRLKQYQLQKFLENSDNGWIQEKSQFYRGAKQIEDEEEWGRKFYYTILSSNEIVDRDFFLVRESLRDLPHDGDTNLSQEIRSLSKILAERNPAFMELRIKIHGNPEKEDTQAVENWLKEHEKKIKKEDLEKFELLIDKMHEFFKPVSISELEKMVSDWDKNSFIYNQVSWFSSTYKNETDPSIIIPAASGLMCDIRVNLKEDRRGTRRTSALELSLRLEELIFQQASQWNPNTIREHIDKIYALSEALASAGYIEQWEWDLVENDLHIHTDATVKAKILLQFIQKARQQLAWGSGMVKSIYGDTVEQYASFEPLALGFYDDKIRSSLLLPLGDAIGDFSGLVSRQIGMENNVPVVDNTSTIKGLNPGYAIGTLHVVSGDAHGLSVNSSDIYVFETPPSDLKPVAGIATVSEGNLVSHVQLLARNLGIPNAVISTENLSDLKKLDGKLVFYAVSPNGIVHLFDKDQLSNEEQDLFTASKSKDKKEIRIDENRLKLEITSPVDMATVTSKDSGILCGPKAANLGQLKQLFPEKVVNGIVLPFGVFKDHMLQSMPDYEGTYWDFLNNAFAKAKQLKQNGSTSTEVEQYQLDQLEILRSSIKTMPLKPSLIEELEKQFKSTLGSKLGNVPVFLRSDTNMEDLEEFTGAGLNLTVFNVVEREKILQGIRDVWASPYTERSFKWRQAYLSNPESVYPSILIIPTVDVDYSGVLITKDFLNNHTEKVTVAMSRGAGGAVDGQSAETYLIHQNGTTELIAPARENKRRRLPVTGGSYMEHVDFNHSILNEMDLNKILQFAQDAHATMPESKNGTYKGAWDIELGFKDGKLFLFQIRPFVENQNALSHPYLQKMDEMINTEIELLTSKEIHA